MIPKYHRSYWMGLRAGSPKNFVIVDPTVPPLNVSSSYKHWGMDEADSSVEPNNKLGGELCAASNWTQAYGRPSAWGWADTKCNNQLPTMCRLLRECNDTVRGYSQPPSEPQRLPGAQSCRVVAQCIASLTARRLHAAAQRWVLTASTTAPSRATHSTCGTRCP